MPEIKVGVIGNFSLKNPIIDRQFCYSNRESNVRFEAAKFFKKYDVVLVLNESLVTRRIKVKTNYLWKLVQEPYVFGITPFVYIHDSIYSRIFSHWEEDTDPRVEKCPPLIPWFVGKTDEELLSQDISSKPLDVSIIASTKSHHDGHDKRSKFVDLIQQQVAADLFGRGREKEVSDKWEALAQYKYSIAIENSSQNNYWTEKIVDCFLANTIPFYYGAPNINEYFPEDSYIWLPIDDPEKCVQVIKDELLSNSWKKREKVMIQAKEKCLNEYATFEYFKKIIIRQQSIITNNPYISVNLKGKYSRIEYWLRRLLNKL